MFSKAIVKSEEFSVMPKSSQALYFHLGMEADDDGFIHPGQIMRAGGFQGDDLKILLAKRFLLAFESGVVVIKHWLIHNLIQKDRHVETRYQDELKSLFIKENRAYSDNDPILLQSVNKVLPQVRLGKGSIGKDNITPKGVEKLVKEDTPIQKLTNYFFELKGWDYKDKTQKIVYSRFTRPAKDLLSLCDQNIEEAKSCLKKLSEWAISRELDWSIETVFKKWHDLDFLKPKEKVPYYDGKRIFQKVKEGKWWCVSRDGEIRELGIEPRQSEIIYK